MGLWSSIAKHLPKRLVTECYKVVLSHATSGQYAKTDASSLTALEMFNRWAMDNHKYKLKKSK